MIPVITHYDLGLNDALADEMSRAELAQTKASGSAGESASQKSAANTARKNELKVQKSDAEDKLRDLKTKSLDALATVRERYTTAKLERARPDLFSDRTILFPSNEAYQFHKEGESEDKISLETTNIPKIRTIAIESGGDALLRNNRKYMLRILSVIHVAKILVDEARPSALLSLVTKFSTEVDALHEVDRAQNCADRFAQDIAADLDIFVAAAVTATSKAYQALHASVFRAVVVRHGMYRRKTKDRTVYPEHGVLDQIVDSVIAAIVAMDENIKALPNTGLIYDMLIIAIERIRHLRHSSKDGLEADLSVLLQNATTSELETAYFVKAMHPIYEVAKAETGRGCTDRMRKAINHRLTHNDTNPFIITYDTMKTTHRRAAEKHITKLHTEIKKITHSLIEGLRRASNVKHRSAEEKETWNVIGKFLSDH
ncbi:uncharacterized protein MYCFIDRAFT_196815 [Pseudocercospora fijiensis CIRAD86]|uniref:DUF7605 domain-containing protein n=1 Tax=Pseudocercospora fijiensis (strain CIRAD86) TaxID=383855 RepID=M2Z169_PSEFD|nr:uncharacterized protein MYCFIDRAFT_196815 [Pseudocercospora fijiensis CIRAD86]EME83585.1 hypothetical protein MYCFIDRAFT_196815 [Pseudocercospora fijiensis CIRAD86]